MPLLTALLENTEKLTNAEFWEALADAVIDSGVAIDDHNETIRKLLTKERCLDVHARFGAMTDDEVTWMGAKKRRGKKVRVYRAAPVGKIAGFRFHTNLDHAISDLPPDVPRSHLFVGEVDVDSILLRIMSEGRKIVIAAPERVKALQVQELVKKDDATATELAHAHNVQTALQTVGGDDDSSAHDIIDGEFTEVAETVVEAVETAVDVSFD